MRLATHVCAERLPRFPRGARWDRDPDFDSRVSAIKTVRDGIAERLDMDTGVLCSRDRMEAVARAKPKAIEDFESITELRRWQVEVLANGFLGALRNHQAPPAQPVGEAEDRSPYKE